MIISADSHVVEPFDLWQQRLPDALKPRAPRIEEDDGRWVFVVEGNKPRKMGGSGGGGGSGGDENAERMRSGGWDPAQRVTDLDEDGVWGEVLYPTIALFGFMIPDDELRHACARVYNDWLGETFAPDPRFAAAALIPVQDIEFAVDEI